MEAIEAATALVASVGVQEDGSCPPLCPRDVCGLGFEQALVVPLLMAGIARAKRKRKQT